MLFPDLVDFFAEGISFAVVGAGSLLCPVVIRSDWLTKSFLDSFLVFGNPWVLPTTEGLLRSIRLALLKIQPGLTR